MTYKICSQPLPQIEDSTTQSTSSYLHRQFGSAHLGVKLMMGYLYFMQGFMFTLADTIPLTYKQLPQYLTMSIFTLSTLPFCVKFLTAPLIERYSCQKYGRYKTWLICTQFLSVFLLVMCSFFTQLAQARILAVMLVSLYFCLSIQDIALDALSLKQIKDRPTISIVQTACYSSGLIIGSNVLLKTTSLQFALSIGLTTPLLPMDRLLLVLACSLQPACLLIHLYFTQTPQPPPSTPLRQLYSAYILACRPHSRHFRLIAWLLLYYQGINTFDAGYTYQLIHAGFSRDVYTTVQCVRLVVTVLVIAYGRYVIEYVGYSTGTRVFLVSIISVHVYVLVVFPLHTYSIVFITFLCALLKQSHNLLILHLCSTHAQYFDIQSSIWYTLYASCAYAGKNMFGYVEMLRVLEWRWMAVVGVGYGGVMVAVAGWVYGGIKGQDGDQGCQFEGEGEWPKEEWSL